jgi:hypothetical protein
MLLQQLLVVQTQQKQQIHKAAVQRQMGLTICQGNTEAGLQLLQMRLATSKAS